MPKHTLRVGRVPAKALVEVVSALVEGAGMAARLNGGNEPSIEVTSLAGGVVELDASELGAGTAIDPLAVVESESTPGPR